MKLLVSRELVTIWATVSGIALGALAHGQGEWGINVSTPDVALHIVGDAVTDNDVIITDLNGFDGTRDNEVVLVTDPNDANRVKSVAITDFVDTSLDRTDQPLADNRRVEFDGNDLVIEGTQRVRIGPTGFVTVSDISETVEALRVGPEGFQFLALSGAPLAEMNRVDGTTNMNFNVAGTGGITLNGSAGGIAMADVPGSAPFATASRLLGVTSTGDMVSQDPSQVGAAFPSDRRLKENVTTYLGGMDTIRQIRPVSFSYRQDGEANVHYGVVAQELQAIDANLVDTFASGEAEYLGLKLDSIVFALASAVHEADRRLGELEQLLDTLER